MTWEISMVKRFGLFALSAALAMCAVAVPLSNSFNSDDNSIAATVLDFSAGVFGAGEGLAYAAESDCVENMATGDTVCTEVMNSNITDGASDARDLAMSNIPSGAGKASIGLGVGMFGDASAIAMGGAYQLTTQIVLKSAAVIDSDGTYGAGMGVAYSF